MTRLRVGSNKLRLAELWGPRSGDASAKGF